MLEFPQHTRLVYHGLPGGETVTFWSLLVHFRALQRNPEPETILCRALRDDFEKRWGSNPN